MIEKLPFAQIHSGGEDMVDRVKLQPVDTYEMQHKINEIIDTIYDMQLAISKLDPDSDWYDGNHIADISKKVDQCEWLGKLCKFWDGDEQMSHLRWGILSTITPTSPVPYCCSLGDGKTFDYEHCEPVKPDDDIIYKGGDNE